MTTVKLLAYVPLACASAAVTNLLYNYYHRKRNETIFFNGNHISCKDHGRTIYTRSANPSDDCTICKVHTIIGWLNEAKKTLDISMYMFTHKLFLRAVINAHNRGIRVRLILNECNIHTWELGTMGIVKKYKLQKDTQNLMHHKFVIVDDKKVILGSLNWTGKAIRKNIENVIISNERDLVEPYKEEFKQLWKIFDWY